MRHRDESEEVCDGAEYSNGSDEADARTPTTAAGESADSSSKATSSGAYVQVRMRNLLSNRNAQSDSI